MHMPSLSGPLGMRLRTCTSPSASPGSLCYGIVDKGAIQPILVAMETMEDHDDLQQSACWMLSSIAFSTDGKSCRINPSLGTSPLIPLPLTREHKYWLLTYYTHNVCDKVTPVPLFEDSLHSAGLLSGFFL